MLRFPGNLLDLLAAVFLTRRQSCANVRAVSIRPGRLHHDPAQVPIAGLADRTALRALTARVLAADRAAVTHQLSGFVETRDLSKLGHNAHRRNLGDTAQALQSLDYRAHLLRHRLDRRIDRLLQALDAC